MAGPSLRLRGQREFSRTLRGLDLADQVKEANHSVATAVVERAEAEGRALGGVHAYVVRAGSIRASRRFGSVSINLNRGGPAGPTFGAEFGAKRFGQFPSWRGNDEDAGYMVHAAIRQMKASGELLDRYEDAVINALSAAFPDTD